MSDAGALPRALPSNDAPALLGTYGRKFAGDSTTDGCWRENCAGNQESYRQTDKSKNKAVVALLEISSLVGAVDQ